MKTSDKEKERMQKSFDTACDETAKYIPDLQMMLIFAAPSRELSVDASSGDVDTLSTALADCMKRNPLVAKIVVAAVIKSSVEITVTEVPLSKPTAQA